MIKRIEIVVEPERYLSHGGFILKSIDVRVQTDSKKYGYNKVVPESDIKSFFRQIIERMIDVLEEELLKEEDNGK